MPHPCTETILLSADPDLGLADLTRFEEAYREQCGRAFAWDSDGARLLARLFGNSAALAGRLIAHPEWAEAIAASPFLKAPKPESQLRSELSEEIAAASDATAFIGALRRFKYRELIRIAMRDLERLGSEEELLAEWSACADAILDAAYGRAHGEIAGRFGAPLAEDGSPCTGVVMALGKLGGRELNISSDVDLILLYASDAGGTAGGSAASISNHEFFVKLAMRLTKLLATVTAEGFAFRVDHELRPEGPQGPLANSLDAAERYYESFGRDWERQALIRARPVAGDASLGEAFIAAVRPFVYRRHIALSDLSHLREMKQRMEQAAQRRSTHFDLKLGAGGIRDVEFLVQAFCQLYGGANASVRRGNTFEAIRAIAGLGLIHPFAAQSLTESYSFLRRAENMLQLADDVQLHRLPDEPAALERLARRMGYRGDGQILAHFRADLDRHAGAAERLFTALFEADYDRLELLEAIRDNVGRAENEEEEADSLAWFKQQEVRRIRHLDLNLGFPLPQVLRRLTLSAEAVLDAALSLARQRLEARHGLPRREDGTAAAFAIVGMGSLGASEIDYGSDLDLIFITSGGGQTDGERPISSMEYFTRLAQRTISLLSLPGRYGRAYLVDSELRPSGHQGTLVTTLSSFTSYHEGQSQPWERLSLQKARAIAGDPAFLQQVQRELTRLAFELPPPESAAAAAEVLRLRARVIAERAQPAEGALQVKLGAGGLADVEAILRFTQLLHAASCPALRRQNSFELIGAMGSEGILDPETCDALSDHLLFFRRLISRTRLLTDSSGDLLLVSDPRSEAIAAALGAGDREGLLREVGTRMEAVRGLLHRTISEN